MTDYSKGKIYKIVSDNIEGTYYGSTVDTLWSRFGTHNSKFRMWKKGSKAYCTSFKLIEAGNAKIFLVENYPCNSKIELTARERWYIENNECVNKNVPNRTWKEYQKDNKEKIKKYMKEYMKEYQKDNKDKLKEYKKEYRKDKKEKIKEYQKLTFQCICDGEEHNLHHKARHFKTQYHITNLKLICDIHGVNPSDLS